MKLTVPKVIGKNVYNFEVEGDNLHAVVMESQKLSFRDVTKCGLCESDWLYLTAYVTKEGGYEYVKVVCAKCRGSITFGKAKEKKDVYFLRKTQEGRLDWQEDTRAEKKEVKPQATSGGDSNYSGGGDEAPF